MLPLLSFFTFPQISSSLSYSSILTILSVIQFTSDLTIPTPYPASLYGTLVEANLRVIEPYSIGSTR